MNKIDSVLDVGEEVVVFDFVIFTVITDSMTLEMIEMKTMTR